LERIRRRVDRREGGAIGCACGIVAVDCVDDHHVSETILTANKINVSLVGELVCLERRVGARRGADREVRDEAVPACSERVLRLFATMELVRACVAVRRPVYSDKVLVWFARMELACSCVMWEVPTCAEMVLILLAVIVLGVGLKRREYTGPVSVPVIPAGTICCAVRSNPGRPTSPVDPICHPPTAWKVEMAGPTFKKGVAKPNWE